MEKFVYVVNEIQNRDQDIRAMYMSNDWTGWGVTEVLENMVCLPIL